MYATAPPILGFAVVEAGPSFRPLCTKVCSIPIAGVSAPPLDRISFDVMIIGSSREKEMLGVDVEDSEDEDDELRVSASIRSAYCSEKLKSVALHKTRCHLL